MQYRTLGRSGIKISSLALGTDNFANPTPEKESIEIINTALDAGINLIDTSNSYAKGNAERIIGRALQQNGRRHDVVLATKAYFPQKSDGPNRHNHQGGSRLHLIKACEDSLKRFQTDHIDLYQLHRPDFDVPIEETLSALTDLVRSGKIRYIGSSTAPAWRIMEALMTSELKGFVRFVSEQPPYNLLDRRIENELVPMCQKHEIGILPWSPLAMGILAGRYAGFEKDGQHPAGSRAALRGGIYAERITKAGVIVGNKFVALAKEIGISAVQLAILWVKDQPGVTAPLIGPRTLAQLVDDYLPVANMSLSDEARAACDAMVPPGSVVANFHNSAPWMKMKV
ncbi:MAG: aryl-alcohol dehydrogenase-like predicted oxidoreductase [Cellvibrionaceae bacterium]|jgi:aryl-alcohol dehydrogenase-like predicted oxidoreductase